LRPNPGRADRIRPPVFRHGENLHSIRQNSHQPTINRSRIGSPIRACLLRACKIRKLRSTISVQAWNPRISDDRPRDRFLGREKSGSISKRRWP
jgi:hypothetical protein